MVGNWQVFDFGNGPGADRRGRIERSEERRLTRNKKARDVRAKRKTSLANKNK